MYAVCEVGHRPNLWQHLCLLRSTTSPWLVVGDFNVVRDCTKRLGGRTVEV